jgi:hypothetical protein
VDTRLKTQKNPILNSPIPNLFAIQRKTPKFPPNKKLHLVTLFSVCLRVFPFSELDPKTQTTKNLFNPAQLTQSSAISHRPILKGPPTDLIFFVTRYL